MILESVKLKSVPFEQFDLFLEFGNDDLFLILFDGQWWVDYVLGGWVLFATFRLGHLWETGAFAWSHFGEAENELYVMKYVKLVLKLTTIFLSI